MSRDEFTNRVKLALAQRAGFRCSFPTREAVTIGPSDEADDASSSTGTAAHITAASSGRGARRYDPSLNPAERSSIENGLWCCRTHGTLIDTDEVTYSIPMLKRWRQLAERKAKLRQMHGDIDLTAHPDLVTDGLAPNKIMVNPTDDANQLIGVSLINSCCHDIWGKRVADAIRDFLVEFVRNAFEHSDASQVEIELQTSAIVIIDDGAHFDIAELAAHPDGRGGQLAYNALLSELRIHAVTCRSTERGNSMHIPLVCNPRELIAVSPCAVEVHRETLRDRRFEYASVRGCNTIYLVAPDYLSYSDIPLLHRLALDCTEQTRRSVVLVLSKASEGVLAHAAYVLKGIKVVAW